MRLCSHYCHHTCMPMYSLSLSLSLSLSHSQTHTCTCAHTRTHTCEQVNLSSVFKAVHAAKQAGLQMEDWAVTSATLEEVFIRLARVTDDTHLV